MTKAQEVYERTEALVASGVKKADAFRQLAETFLRDGHVQSLQEQMISFGDVKRVLNVEGTLGLRDSLERAGEP